MNGGNRAGSILLGKCEKYNHQNEESVESNIIIKINKQRGVVIWEQRHVLPGRSWTLLPGGLDRLINCIRRQQTMEGILSYRCEPEDDYYFLLGSDELSSVRWYICHNYLLKLSLQLQLQPSVTVLCH